MNEVWDSKYSRVVQWDGDPQNAPDTCETCDGVGSVVKVTADHMRLYDDAGNYLPTGAPANGRWTYAYISTTYVLEEQDCPECRGYGQVY